MPARPPAGGHPISPQMPPKERGSTSKPSRSSSKSGGTGVEPAPAAKCYAHLDAELLSRPVAALAAPVEARAQDKGLPSDWRRIVFTSVATLVIVGVPSQYLARRDRINAENYKGAAALADRLTANAVRLSSAASQLSEVAVSASIPEADVKRSVIAFDSVFRSADSADLTVLSDTLEKLGEGTMHRYGTLLDVAREIDTAAKAYEKLSGRASSDSSLASARNVLSRAEHRVFVRTILLQMDRNLRFDH